MTTLPQFSSSNNSNVRSVLLQIEDQYNKRIDDDIAKLVDCFADIVKVGEVPFNYQLGLVYFSHLSLSLFFWIE
jgi:hypothetical protein